MKASSLFKKYVWLAENGEQLSCEMKEIKFILSNHNK